MTKALLWILQFNAGSVSFFPTECLLHHTGLSQEQLAEGRGKLSVMPLSCLYSCTEFGRGLGGNQDTVRG